MYASFPSPSSAPFCPVSLIRTGTKKAGHSSAQSSKSLTSGATNHPEALNIFRDAYNVESLGLPSPHAEAHLHRGLLDKLKDFLIELGRDFRFVASEYPLQVGGRDFALDLLFFHRGLNCLVAIELKVGRFEPEYLGKLAFYLEALDRDLRKAHEQSSIGVLLCASKNDEVRVVIARGLVPSPNSLETAPTAGTKIGTVRRSIDPLYG